MTVRCRRECDDIPAKRKMQNDKIRMKVQFAVLLIVFSVFIRDYGETVEAIVCIRHGERPRNQLGQLACRGLIRVLALLKVLLAKYGFHQFIFASNLSQKVKEYYYVGPLATIELIAIRCGFPFNIQFDYRRIEGLEQELCKKECRNSTV